MSGSWRGVAVAAALVGLGVVGAFVAMANRSRPADQQRTAAAAPEVTVYKAPT